MLLSAHDARRFIKTYERVAMAIHVIRDLELTQDSRACLVRARQQFCDTPDLLDEAVVFLKQRESPVDPAVVKALSQMQLASYIHLKDLKTGSIFLSSDGSEVYSVVGLTQRPADIIGQRGSVLKTAFCPFAGKIVCDGLFLSSAQVGPQLWRSCHQRYLALKAAGRLHRHPGSVPAWQASSRSRSSC